MHDEQRPPEEIEVKLKPILGVRPTTYVPVLYGLALLIVIFLVLVLPGIRHNGSRVRFDVSPPVSSIRIDGVPVGTAPGELFVASGLHTVEVVHPGFASFNTTLDVGGRVFGSLLFPRRAVVRATLMPDDLSGRADDVSIEFAEWSLNGDAAAQYQFPSLARILGRDFWYDSDGDQQWLRFVRNALPNVTSEALLSDLVSGDLAVNGAGVATPQSIASTISRLADVVDETPGLAVQIDDVLSGERSDSLRLSSWYTHLVDAVETAQAAAEGSGGRAAPRDIVASVESLGLRFVAVPAYSGVLPGSSHAARGGDMPSVRTVGAFAVSDAEISVAAYEQFLRENPDWLPGNKAMLIERGLVDDDYLVGWDVMRENPDFPVTAVSFHAARAFTAWLSDRYLGGADVGLPTEDEWNVLLLSGPPQGGFFAFAGADRPLPVRDAGGSVGDVVGIAGNVWEWLDDWYGRYTPLYPAAPDGPVAQRVVRGGSWITDKSTYNDMDRGSLPPDWCSSFVGFRVVVR